MPSKADHHRTDHGIYGSPGDVTPWDYRFDPTDRAYLDVRPSGRGRIRIATEPGLRYGRLVVRRNQSVNSHKLGIVATTSRYRYWETEAADLAGTEFSFSFKSPTDRPVYIVPSGVSNAVERNDRFVAPAIDGFTTPPWVHGAVIYQIFPDRFARAAPPTDGLSPWSAPPHSREFKGGDLDGIASRLEHLDALEVEVVYLNPIFTSPSNHRYDTVDYYSVDPMLGGTAAFDRLVEAVHRRGMRMILDASFNHVHPKFFAFEDLLKRGKKSAYRDWFVVNEWPLQVLYRPEHGAWVKDWVPHWRRQLGVPIRRARNDGPVVEPSYDAWYGVPSMPRVNLANREARDYMLGVARHWIVEHGIDGWRMDVARYVDADFWEDLRSTVKSVQPDAYLIAEVMGDASPWLQGNRFDATMNYTFRDLALRFLAQDEMTGTAMLEGLTRLWAQYAWDVTLANQNLLDSHDTSRFITAAGGDQSRLALAILLQMTYPGAPGVYYGNEVGLTGGEDPDSRAAFPWDPPPEQHPLFTVIASLAALRRRNPSLRAGGWQPLGSGTGWLAFERHHEAARIATVINRSKHPVSVQLPRQARRVLWGTAEVAGRTVHIPGVQGAIIRT